MSKEMSDIALAAKLASEIISEKIDKVSVLNTDKLESDLPIIYGQIFEKVLSAVKEMNIPKDYPGVVKLQR